MSANSFFCACAPWGPVNDNRDVPALLEKMLHPPMDTLPQRLYGDAASIMRIGSMRMAAKNGKW